MKAARPLAALVLCAAILRPGILEAQAPSILEPKVERLEGPPLWISAEAVADEEKIIDLDRIDSLGLTKNLGKQREELGGERPLEKFRVGGKPVAVRIPLSECKRTLYVEDDRGGTDSTATLSDLAANSESILWGTIRSIDLGFDSGVPASLLGVEVREAIRGSAPQPLFYIAYPVARFKMGPFHFCNTRNGYEPQLGDDVLLFDFTGPVDRDQILFAPRLDQILFQGQSGTLALPPQLTNDPDLKTLRSLPELVRLLQVGTMTQPRKGER
jgi:hypothetical protein